MLHPHGPAAPNDPSVHEPPGRPWELELLISGAVVFALVQLPGWVDGLYDEFRPHLAGTTRRLLTMGYIIGTLILYSLITTFVVHLAARAYWVGLVGLDAVYPHGVRWEKTRYGPITLRIRQEQQPSLQSLTNAADRFCSVLFSYGFLSAVGLAVGTLVAVTVSLLSLGISQLAFEGRSNGRIFAVLYALLLSFMVIPAWVDRKWGDRIDPEGRLGRAIRSSMRTQYAIMFTRAYLPITDVLSSNVRRWMVAAISMVGFTFIFGLFLGKVLVEDRRLSFAYDYLPEQGSPLLMESVHYLDQRPRGEAYELEPAVQSEVIRGPYVRVFLPYVPRRHDALVRERCPGAAMRPEGESGMPPGELAAREAARERELLRCLREIQPIRLNGEPLPDPGFRFYVDARSGLRGLIAHLPTAGLPAGENLLEVGAVPIPAADLERNETQPAPHPIPLWIAR